MKMPFVAICLVGAVVPWIAPALAQSDLLRRGEVYKVVNTVQLLPNNRPARKASLRDVLAPRDAVKTGNQSRSELLFNEGSLARIGSNSIFRFTPGMRSFYLRHGTALILSPSQSIAAATQVEFPGGTVATLPPGDGTAVSPDQLQMAMLMVVDGSNPENPKVQILALADIDLKITNIKGETIILKGGEMLMITNGNFSPITTINLKLLYGSTNLALGLGEGDRHTTAIAAEALEIQKTLNLIRPSTLAVLRRQAAVAKSQIEGLCTLNARGNASTLATNCITTTTDDPLSTYQNNRDVTTDPPPREQPPVIDQPPPTPPTTPPTIPPVTPPITPPTTPPTTNPNVTVILVPQPQPTNNTNNQTPVIR
ncbi:hypothetical protein [Alkalinema sp. FACHB-956]|uniref:hypothetical protein n=1 Tax=Alkalinema sp. FACHB-956 TaxID=2692768 RepID=UPI00168598FE|nr:hypothetical protein [Alkalinema sp. FACHB-956]MBD2328341.1 hypothetical protein [Alkalinema sp. FACHB-956]